MKLKIYNKNQLNFDIKNNKYYFKDGLEKKHYINIGDIFEIKVLGEKIIVEVVYSPNTKQFPRGYCLVQEGFNKGLWLEDVDQFEYKSKLSKIVTIPIFR